MTLAGKFTDVLPSGQAAHLGGHLHVDTVSTHAPAGAIIVPDAHLLFTGDFKRAGLDLVLSGDGRELVLHDYFKGEKRAALASTDGAHLTGDIVNALTGHTQLAQADGSPSVAQVIGHVTKLVGTATAIRNGVSIILNQGDNVNKGDVVQSGSDSSLGITFIDGSVFGLASNAKMVLNEMIYDPNGSNNSSLISLVQGTISFVAGGTAKKGDMKVDTPVATMGIRGTAVLVEIDFVVPGTGGAPPAKFQVLVEPDGTTGSYILFDKTTLTPIATVNQAGTQTIVNGQGTVNFLSSVQLSPDAQKIISDVFQLKFTDLNNPQSLQRFGSAPTLDSFFFKTANGDNVAVTVKTVQFADTIAPSTSGTPPKGQDHIPGPPDVVTTNAAFTERAGLTGSKTSDAVTGEIRYSDLNPGDMPTAQATFDSFKYQNAQHNDVTASLTPEQIAAIKAVQVPLTVLQDPALLNHGTATWSYEVPDGAFDFLAAGETLTLTYMARVDNNFAANNEITFKPITITITGTNDVPTVATSGGTVIERIGTGNTAVDSITGTVTFTDADLTDRPVVSAALSATEPFRYLDAEGHNVTAELTPAQLAAIEAVKIPLSVVQNAGNTHNGSATWTYSIADHAFDFIAKGETLILNYVIQVNDGHGGVVSTPVSISVNGADVTVVGTNDIPTIATTDAAFAEQSNETQPNPTGSTTPDTVSGTITFADVDLTDRPVASAAFTSFTYTDASGHALTLNEQQQAAVAAVEVPLTVVQTSGNTNDGSATWTYSVADGAFDFLAGGEILTLTYTATVDDGHGGVVTKPITITITGTNDTATATTTNAAFTEMAGTGNTALDHAGGTISFNDADLSDRPVVTAQFSDYSYKAADGSTSLTLTPQQAVDLEAGLSLTAAGGNTNTGSVAWSYDVADSKFDFLAAGEVLTLTYLATVNDNHGGVISKPITVTITGTNDAPTVAAVDAGTLTDSAVNDGFGNLTGTLVGYDPDHDETASLSYGALDLTGHPVNSAIAGHYGSLTVNADGTWSYVANATVINALHAGSYTETFTVQTTDVHNAVGTAVLTVHVNGANDTPTLADVAAGTLTDSAANDSFNDLTGELTGNDRDSGETATLQYAAIDDGNPVHTAVAGHYGSLTVNADGTWTYVPDAAAINALHAGSYTDTFTVQTTDVHGASATAALTVDVTGANDTPSLSAVHAGTLVDTAAYDSFDNLTGTLVGADRDSGETASLHYAALDAHNAVVATVVGDYGSLTVNPDGTYTYVANAAAINALPAGAYTDTFTVQTTDVNGAVGTAVLTVDVTGATDAPSITGETDAPTQAVMVVPGASAAVLAAGVNTNSMGLNTETFDGQLASSNGIGHGSFYSAALDATFSGTGSAGIVNGSYGGITAAPFLGPLPGAVDATNYLSVGGGGAETITFGAEQNAFGLYWGSVDSYNMVSFYDGTKLVASYSGADVAPLFSDGNQDSFSSNGYVEFSGLGQFNKVVLTSSASAFEIDNVSAGTLAQPHAGLAAPVAGTLSVHDADIGDALTASVTGNAIIEFIGADGSTHLPDGVDVAALIDAHDLTFDTVQSTGGTDVLHWSYNPTDPDLDFLHAGDVLKIKFAAQVDAGQVSTGSQPVTVTLVGANSATDTSAFSVVHGTSGNDTFDNVGNNVTIFGNGGMDRFIFKAGFGSATIADFDVSKDTIDISQSLFDSIADILASAHPVNSNHDTIITDAALDTIVLRGVTAAQLHASNFHLT